MGVVFCDCFKKAKQNHQEPSLSQETNNNSKDVSEENTAPLLPKAKSNEQSDFPISNINSNVPLKRFESKNSKMSIGDDFFFGIDKAVIIGKGTGNPKEIYQFGIYVKDVGNIIDYDTEDSESDKNVEYVVSKNVKRNKNQILLSQEEIEKMKKDKI